MAYCRFWSISRKQGVFTQPAKSYFFPAVNVSSWSQQWYLLCTFNTRFSFFFPIRVWDETFVGLPATSPSLSDCATATFRFRSLILQCQESCHTCFDPLVHNFVLGCLGWSVDPAVNIYRPGVQSRSWLIHFPKTYGWYRNSPNTCFLTILPLHLNQSSD